MRSPYSAQLDALTGQVVDLCRMAGTAMDRATLALLQADLSMAEGVIEEHELISESRARAEESGLQILLRWAPVARDLRTTVNSIQISSELERMGDLAVYVATIARRRHPLCAIPAEVSSFISELSRMALDLGVVARNVLASSDTAEVPDVQAVDGVVDGLHRRLLAVVEERDWRYGMSAAVDVTQLGRCYQRFSDHAVRITRRVLVTSGGGGTAEGRGQAWFANGHPTTASRAAT